MAIICPIISASNPHAYREQVARVQPIAHRLHIEVGDGSFKTQATLQPAQIYWPESCIADIHVLFQEPQTQFETLVSLRPNTVIIQAEAQGDLLGMLLELKAYGIKAGVALLFDSQPDDYAKLMIVADYILLAGSLNAENEPSLEAAQKLPSIKAINPTAEISWDNVMSAENAAFLSQQGVQVLTVGALLHTADDPTSVFRQLSDVTQM